MLAMIRVTDLCRLLFIILPSCMAGATNNPIALIKTAIVTSTQSVSCAIVTNTTSITSTVSGPCTDSPSIGTTLPPTPTLVNLQKVNVTLTATQACTTITTTVAINQNPKSTDSIVKNCAELEAFWKTTYNVTLSWFNYFQNRITRLTKCTRVTIHHKTITRITRTITQWTRQFMQLGNVQIMMAQWSFSYHTQWAWSTKSEWSWSQTIYSTTGGSTKKIIKTTTTTTTTSSKVGKSPPIISLHGIGPSFTALVEKALQHGISAAQSGKAPWIPRSTCSSLFSSNCSHGLCQAISKYKEHKGSGRDYYSSVNKLEIQRVLRALIKPKLSSALDMHIVSQNILHTIYRDIYHGASYKRPSGRIWPSELIAQWKKKNQLSTPILFTIPQTANPNSPNIVQLHEQRANIKRLKVTGLIGPSDYSLLCQLQKGQNRFQTCCSHDVLAKTIGLFNIILPSVNERRMAKAQRLRINK